MSGIKETYQQSGSLSSLAGEITPSSDILLMALRMGVQDVKRVVDAVGDFDSGLPFVRSTLLQTYAENLKYLEDQADSLSTRFDEDETYVKTWKKPVDPLQDINRTISQPALLPFGIRLDQNSNKYAEDIPPQIEGEKDWDQFWDKGVLRNSRSKAKPTPENLENYDQGSGEPLEILKKKYEEEGSEGVEKEPSPIYQNRDGLRIEPFPEVIGGSGEVLDPILTKGIYKRSRVGEIGTEEQQFLSTNFIGTIPLSFEIITSKEVHTLYLPAYLESLSDTFTGQVSGTQYIGRAEEVFTYTGFKRNGSFSFILPALSSRELIPLYHKLSLLTGTTAPTYGGSSFMQGTMVRLTIGEFFKDLPGYITSVGVTWDKNISWELDGDSFILLPHVLKVDVQFQPIHDKLVETGTPFYVDLSKQRGQYTLESNQRYKIKYSGIWTGTGI